MTIYLEAIIIYIYCRCNIFHLIQLMAILQRRAIPKEETQAERLMEIPNVDQ